MLFGAVSQVLGEALGRCPKEKLFKGYIQLELQLGEVDRCRTLYSKYLASAPHNCQAWIKYVPAFATATDLLMLHVSSR